jgi:hypothetical protein
LRLQKIRRIFRILVLTKDQAVLRNPCAYKKSGGFSESKNQADDRILAGVEIPAPGKKPAGLEKQAARLLFRIGGISSC